MIFEVERMSYQFLDILSVVSYRSVSKYNGVLDLLEIFMSFLNESVFSCVYVFLDSSWFSKLLTGE